MPKYRSVSIPNDLIDNILDKIKKKPELGYRTYSEFIIDAIRRRLEDIEKE